MKTKQRVTLRPATMEDAELLLAWRNDPQSRLASHNPAEIERGPHLRWLADLLADSRRTLCIAEEGGAPAGMVRADWVEDAYLLSWIVAPTHRGRGIGREMVQILVGQLDGPVRAEIKAWNQASLRIAEQAGLAFVREVAGIRHYERDARPHQGSSDL